MDPSWHARRHLIVHSSCTHRHLIVHSSSPHRTLIVTHRLFAHGALIVASLPLSCAYGSLFAHGVLRVVSVLSPSPPCCLHHLLTLIRIHAHSVSALWSHRALIAAASSCSPGYLVARRAFLIAHRVLIVDRCLSLIVAHRCSSGSHRCSSLLIAHRCSSLLIVAHCSLMVLSGLASSLLISSGTHRGSSGSHRCSSLLIVAHRAHRCSSWLIVAHRAHRCSSWLIGHSYRTKRSLWSQAGTNTQWAPQGETSHLAEPGGHKHPAGSTKGTA